MPVITSLYAALLSLVLAWGVWRARNFAKGLRVPFRHRGEITGDVPWAVLLLLLLELAQMPVVLLHAAAGALLITVIFHVRRVTVDFGRWPVSSAATTILVWGWILLAAGMLGIKAMLMVVVPMLDTTS